ncbi:MAG: U32 family peptidase [Bacteroidales bacterium]|nr:U32 family peptidase [Bacteroidales bacterium]MCF8332545.1 U32 family peptidase [Bacteroidales bacterium]
MGPKDIEIMAPVGSYASLRAAIQGGADSVYFGAGHLNMRSKSSQNFTLDDLEKIVSIAGENNVRTYLTVNTIIYDDELEEMRQIIDTAARNKVSAIIATDYAAIQHARQQGMEVHISTQSNITNIEEVRFFSQWADVMVTARELNLNQVASITKAIKEQDIRGPSRQLVQLEIFAHGALCMAISGKCYLSLHNFNESANRGACLQPCRRAYDVKDKAGEVELEVDNEYIMSPKDLKTVHFLNKILDAGVRVLKIEGRGRSPEYVKKVTEVYREAVNAWFQGSYTPDKIEKWNKKLKTVYNRGFWDGYYLGQRLGEWSEKYGSQATRKKYYVGKVTNYYSRIGVIELRIDTNTISQGDGFRIIGDTTGVYEDTVEELRVDQHVVKKATKGDYCSIPVKQVIRRGDKFYKVVEVKQEQIDFQNKP